MATNGTITLVPFDKGQDATLIAQCAAFDRLNEEIVEYYAMRSVLSKNAWLLLDPSARLGVRSGRTVLLRDLALVLLTSLRLQRAR